MEMLNKDFQSVEFNKMQRKKIVALRFHRFDIILIFIGLLMSFLDTILSSLKGTENVLTEGWNLTLVILGILLVILPFAILNIRYNKILNKIDGGNFSKEIRKIINNTYYDYTNNASNRRDAIESHIKSIVFQLKFLSYFTKDSLEFQPDSDANILLQTSDSIISFTEANPIEWLNPTYNYFLIENLITSLINQFSTKKGNSFDFSKNRNCEKFKKYLKFKKELLQIFSDKDFDENKLKESLTTNPTTVRFYILTKSVFEENRRILELLIYAHELFGIYLYIIDKEKFKENLKSRYSELTSLLQQNGHDDFHLDFAVGISNSGFRITFRKGKELQSKKMTRAQSANLAELLRVFSLDILKRHWEGFDDGYVLYGKNTPDNFTENLTNNYIIVKNSFDNAKTDQDKMKESL